MPQTIAKPYSAVKKQENRTEMESFAAGKNIPVDKTILKLHYDDNGALLSKTVGEAPSPLASFARAVPTALPANIAGAGAGVAVSGAGTALAGPWVGIPAGFVAAGATGMGVDKLINKGIEKINPKWAEILETDRQVNPKASLAGSLISGAGAQKNLSIAGLKALAKSGGSAEKFGQLLKANPDIAALGGKSGDIVKGALTHVGTSAGLGFGQDLAMQKLSGRDDLDYTSALESGALMPFIGGGRLRFGAKMAARPAEMITERRAALAPRTKSQFGIDTDSNARHDAYVKYAELVSKAKPGEVPAILEDLKNTWGITASEKDLATAADTINAARTKKLKEEAEKAKNTADKLSDSIKSGDLAANGLDPELVDHVKKSDLRDHGKPLTTEQAENLLLKPEFADIVAPYLESFKAKKAAEAAELKAKEDAKAVKEAEASTGPKTTRDRLLEAKAAGKLTATELDPELVKHLQKSPIRFNGKALTKEQAESMLSDPAFADDVAPHLESYVKAQQEALAPEVKPVIEATTAVAPATGEVIAPADTKAPIKATGNKPVSDKTLSGRPQQTEFTDADLPVLEGIFRDSLSKSRLAPKVVDDLWQENQGALINALSRYPESVSRDPVHIKRAIQGILRGNRKLESSRVSLSPEEMDAAAAGVGKTEPVTSEVLEGSSTTPVVEPEVEAQPLTGQTVPPAKPTVPKPTVKAKGPTHNLVTGDKIVVNGKEGEIVGFVTNSPNRARVRFADGVKLVNVGKMKKPEAPVATSVEAPATPAEPPKTGQPIAEPAPAAPAPSNPAELLVKIGKLVKAHEAMADAYGDTEAMHVVDGMSNDLIDNHKLTPDQVALINRKIAEELDKGNDINGTVSAAIATLPKAPKTGKPFQPLPLKGNVGAGLGGVGDMARAVYNITGRTVESAGQTLGRINKGFKEGRGAEGRPDFIRSSAVDTLRPAFLKMNLDREGKYDGDQLLGRLVNTMAPAEKEVLLGNGLEAFLKGSRRTPEEVAKFIEENGPQVEVKKLYAKEETDALGKLRQEQSNLAHELETLGYDIYRPMDSPNLIWHREQGEVHVDSMPREARQKRDKILDLANKAAAIEVKGGSFTESATATYTMVNPKPLKNMPGAVDILVRIPTTKFDPTGTATTPAQWSRGKDIKYSSGHYPNEGINLLAHVRGYMETLPDSRKVFHVFEVQSDWAQQRREDVKSGKFAPGHGGESLITPDDPLLKDYNRLALKAAVEHAYNEGADAIAISDAETAMMSERHDRSASVPAYKEEHIGKFGLFQRGANQKTHEKAFNTLEEAQKVADQQNEWYKANELSSGHMMARQIAVEDTIPVVKQEPGMRFNYDPNPATAGRSNKPGALHELAAEITKYPGERVSFGPHQNAFKDTVWQAEQNQRSDLIFKNPDGTPKTDITAQLYPIDKVAAKLELSPFAVAGKGPRGQVLYMFPLHTIALDGAKALFKLAGRAFNAATVRAGAGTGERLAATQGPSGAYVLDVTSPTFYRSERQYRNHFLEPIDDAGRLKLSSDQWKTIGQYADDIRELGVSPINLTADEKRGYDFIRESYDRSRIAQIASGKLINGRAANLTADFVPRTVMNQKVRSILNGPDSPERSHYIDLYRNWAKHQDPRLTQGQIDNMLADVLGKDPFGGKRNPTFSPLEQAEGIGLPPEMREDNALTVAKYYAIRSATGLAWHKAVETDPIAARIFGELPKADAEKNTVGYDTPEILPSHTNASDYLVTGYGPSEYARNLTGDPYLEAYRQDMAMGSHQNYDWVDNMTAVVNGFKLGPKTAMRDVVSSLLGSQLEIAHLNEVPKLLKAVSDVYYGRSTAVKAGAVKRHSAAESAIEESLRKTAGRIADVMRKYQGQDLMEKGVREILFEYGRGIAESRYLQNDTEFLESYGSKQWKKFDAKDHNDLLDRMATKFVEQLQGSYSPDYLPRSLTRGAGPSWTKATLSLSRWGIERFRRYRQTVVEPLAKGDARPFLRSTAAYLGLAAPAVYALEELLTEKKPLYMTNGEFFNLLNDDGTPSKAKMDEFAYTVLGRAQLVGMAGIFTGALYQMMQARHGEHTSGFNNPGWGAIEDMGARIRQYWNAYSGSDFFTHLHELPYETLMNETQSLRLLRGAMDNKEDSGNREEQIYKRVTGQTKFKVGSAYRSDPFNPVSKMKKAETVGDIMDQEEPLTRMYEGAPPQEPANFPRRIRHDFGYYNFLDKIQGDGAGEAQLQKDMSGQVFNPIRSMVAKKAFIKAKARNLADELAP